MRLSIAIVVLIASLSFAEESPPSFVAKYTSEMAAYPGYFDFYWDDTEGKLFVDVDKLDTEFLYVTYLSSGLGSNDVGLDRGQIESTRVVHFQRVGPRVLLVQPNLRYRALSDNPAEVTAVEQAFAKSILWGFDIVAEDDDSVLVDATEFFLRDAIDVPAVLKRTDQGSFSKDDKRSAINFERTRNFPINTEVDAWLTFAYQGGGKGEPPGAYVRDVAANPDAITVAIHHSLIQLPDDNYEPREFDPRSGAFAIRFADYATPIDQPLDKQWIERHRLEKQDPNAGLSDPVEPIVYYLDPGTPEPIRSALLEGARWWNEAFEAAGYRNAFRVEMLPDGADMLDIRYNVIQWVHRATRGWSYGNTVTDPRTGEIIKGHVTLGSLRVRQDFLIAQGLKAPFPSGDEEPTEALAFALARLRQLSAHEVGHTIGFAHNFASSVNGRASVMDYPHPLVTLDNGTIDFSNAYDVGIGEWDKVSVAYAYQDFPDGVDEAAALNDIVQSALDDGLLYISDQDARPLGGAHPYAHLWDNGPDAAAELERVLAIRRHALDAFSEANIPTGAPMASLEEVLVPIYYFHRYQVEAAAKLLGGVGYTYALRGDGQATVAVVPPDVQRAALEALLDTLEATALTLPENILRLIPPRAYDMPRHRETFDIRTGVTLDPIAIAEASAAHTLDLLLHPARANRLVEQNARNDDVPALSEVFDALLDATWLAPAGTGLAGQVHRGVNDVVLNQLIELATANQASPMTQALAEHTLADLAETLVGRTRRADAESAAQMHAAVRTIQRFLEDPDEFQTDPAPDMPPGSPIGQDFCSMR